MSCWMIPEGQRGAFQKKGGVEIHGILDLLVLFPLSDTCWLMLHASCRTHFMSVENLVHNPSDRQTIDFVDNSKETTL